MRLNRHEVVLGFNFVHNGSIHTIMTSIATLTFQDLLRVVLYQLESLYNSRDIKIFHALKVKVVADLPSKVFSPNVLHLELLAHSL